MTFTDWQAHKAGSRPLYHPSDVVEWEETVEAVTLETNTTSRPVMNSPADEAEARDRDMRLHGKRIATPRAEDETGSSSRPEARPVTAPARFFTPRPESRHTPRMGDGTSRGASHIPAVLVLPTQDISYGGSQWEPK